MGSETLFLRGHLAAFGTDGSLVPAEMFTDSMEVNRKLISSFIE